MSTQRLFNQQRLFLSIGNRHSRERVLLEVPPNEAIAKLLPDLSLVLDWKEFREIPPACLGLETEDGTPLLRKLTLHESGISNSELLYLSRHDQPDESAEQTGDTNHKQPSRRQSHALDLDAIKLAQIYSQPRLQTASGIIFLLGEPPLTIGRSGKGFAPDIDLTEWDAKMIASRKHALLEKHGDAYVLIAQSTTNGTFINGTELIAGANQTLQPKDRIQFGFQGLDLFFKVA
jgi:hypothetical protein